MKVARTVTACGCALAFAIAVLHVALAPNEMPDEGPADPFLGVRRPMLKAIEAIPFLGVRAKPYLPSASDVTTTKGVNEIPVCRQEIKREPVYRGLFGLAGHRVAYRLTYFQEHDEAWRAVRLCYAVGNERIVAAENSTPDPQRLDVFALVPSSARGHWVEYTDDKGETYWLNTWGRTEPFVDDSSSSPWAPRDRRRAERGG